MKPVTGKVGCLSYGLEGFKDAAGLAPITPEDIGHFKDGEIVGDFLKKSPRQITYRHVHIHMF